MAEVNTGYHCLLTLNSQAEIIDSSGDILPLLGCTCREVKGRSFIQWVESYNPPVLTKTLSSVLTQKQSWFGIVRIPQRNNKISYFYAFIQPEFNGDQNDQILIALTAVEASDQAQVSPIFDKPIRYHVSRFMTRVTALGYWLLAPLTTAMIGYLVLMEKTSLALTLAIGIIWLMQIVPSHRQYTGIRRLLDCYQSEAIDDPFTRYVLTGRHDKWGRLYHLFEQVQQPLRLALQQSDQVALEIGQAAQDGFAAASTVAHRCRQDRSGVTAVVDAVEQIYASIELLTTDLSQTSQYLNQLSQFADQAETDNRRAQSEIKQRQHFNETLKTSLTHMMNDIQSVMEFMDAIGEVAEKTNLSALNSCIEAAQLGSAGSEISKLSIRVREFAHSTQHNVQSIRQTFNQIEQHANDALTELNQHQKLIKSDGHQLLQNQKDCIAMGEIIGQVIGKTSSMSESVKRQILFGGDIDNYLGVLAGLSNTSLEQTHNASMSYRGIQLQAEELNVLVEQVSTKH